MFSWIHQLRRIVLRQQEDAAARLRRRELERNEIAAFCSNVIKPTLEEMKREWERLGRAVAVHQDASRFDITVWYDRMVEFDYSIMACRHPRSRRIYGGVYESPGYVAQSNKVYGLREIRRTSRQKLAMHVVGQYRRCLTVR